MRVKYSDMNNSSPNTFEYRINYKITDKDGNIVTDENILEHKSQKGITLSDNIQDYIHDIISDDVIPPGFELYDIDHDSHHVDHVVYRYEISGIINNNTNMINEFLLSYLRQQIGIDYNIGDNYQMSITSIQTI